MRGGGERVLLWAEQAGELERDAERLARGDGAKSEALKFRVGAVNLEADARPDHDADDGLIDGCVELHRDADGRYLAGMQDDRGLAVLAEGFEREDFGSSVASAEGREEARWDGFAPGALAGGDVVLILRQNFAMVAAGVEAAFVEPPHFVRQRGDELRFVRREQDGGAVAAETLQANRGAGADERVAAGERVVESESGNRRQIQGVGGPEVARDGRGMDLAGIGAIEAGAEPEEFALPAAIFADYGDQRAVGGGGGKLVERREGGFAEMNGHWH